MEDQDWLAARFDEHRGHLIAVAYRMLGSLAEAEDAVQETWLRLSRSDANAIENLGGWLTTVVSRVCLNVLRSRARRGETQLDDQSPETTGGHASRLDPQEEAVLADAVGLALLVVLDTLSPAERLAFVLHDMFAVPFEEIGAAVGRSPAAARQLASRARRRVRGTPAVPPSDLERQREVVEAFLAASRHGDFDALVAVLDPEVELRADKTAIARGTAGLLRGPAAVAEASLVHRARLARTALVNGKVGVVVAPRGRLYLVLRPVVRGQRIAAIEVVADPDSLRQLEIAVPED
ncbi:MAG TPA: sigma-70 family RNA polymerase sigma factor [Acidimicrobiales bacterium]|jgi:RNA polymerase sigma-70 factor (ECF subfamily)|nr:sigma-70 family RNA polymerase sigma factor [Acidimicrobiales bacterium]